VRPKAGYGRLVGKRLIRAGRTAGRNGELEGEVEGEGLRIGIVVSRFNERVTENLLRGAVEALKKHGVVSRRMTIVRVPGAFEIPLVARGMIRTGRYHAIVALGAVIRGETPHFEYISAAVSLGLSRVALESGVPVGFGVLTTNTLRQAMDRASLKGFNQGTQAALTVLETANLLRSLGRPAADGGR
jgi:6,7-dimethyl-8-ribityllumazine synthase